MDDKSMKAISASPLNVKFQAYVYIFRLVMIHHSSEHENHPVLPLNLIMMLCVFEITEPNEDQILSSRIATTKIISIIIQTFQIKRLAVLTSTFSFNSELRADA